MRSLAREFDDFAVRSNRLFGIQRATLEADVERTERAEFAPDEDAVRRVPIVARWYRSVKRGSPWYDVYASPYYLIAAWLAWKHWSRQYVARLADADFPPRPHRLSVIDLGCGLGYSTVTLAERFAFTHATNIPTGQQTDFARDLLKSRSDITLHTCGVLPRADAVFASEYFEHFQRPIEHLDEIIATVQPRYLMVANAFNAVAVGHFNIYRDRRWPADRLGRQTARAFADRLRELGYERSGLKFWNDRPSTWIRRRRS